MCSQQESTWLWAQDREVWFGSQPNNFETLGVGEVTPAECKEGEEVGAQETKTFKGHGGKEELLQWEGKENQREQRRASEAECLSRNGAQCQMMQRVKMEWTRNCGIWQQDVCLGSVAAGLRGVLGKWTWK